MNDTSEDEHDLDKAVQLRAERHDRWLQQGEPSIWQNLSMIGSLGWLVIVPTLAGVFLGRFLDRSFNKGIFWTSALIFAGVTLGCYLAWQKMKEK